jgi:hypothetical protein
LQTKITVDNGPLFPWTKDKAPTFWYDASRVFPDEKTGFDYLVETMKTHATQCPDLASGKRNLAPPRALQRIPFTRLQDNNPKENLCSALSLERPTFDKFGCPPLE